MYQNVLIFFHVLRIIKLQNSHFSSKKKLKKMEVFKCEDCSAVMMRWENGKCCRHGLCDQRINDVAAALLDQFSQHEVSQASRTVNSECSLAIPCSNNTENTFSNFPNQGVTMLYLSGFPHALLKTQHSLIFYDETSTYATDASVKSMSRTAWNILRRSNPLFSTFTASVSQIPENQRATLILSNEPTDRRKIGLISMTALGNSQISAISLETTTKIFSSESEMLEPLLFPMLFPHGSAGWHSNSGTTLMDYRRVSIHSFRANYQTKEKMKRSEI